MTRLRAMLVLTLCLVGISAGAARIDSDARGLFGDETAAATALDSVEGRAITLAIVDPDRDRRSALARAVVNELASDPMVARATASPPVPSAALLDWLWEHRFALAPPPAAAFDRAALASEMSRARRALTRIAAGPLAARDLLDPTGSFRRLVETIAATSPTLPVHDGVMQALDDSAALVFIELADRPFEVSGQAAFDARLRAWAASAGAEALLIGPRPISAEISRELSGRSGLAMAIAVPAVLALLAFALRSPAGIAACLLPPAFGAAVAVLVVQVVFGSVHVLALGFGGALLGLAIDYPLHLMAGGNSDPAGIRRCVRLGAATTAVAFLSLLFAGVPALAHVGVFVAAGLAAAAAAALWLDRDLPRACLGGGWSLPVIRVPRKVAVLGATVAAASAGAWLLPTMGAVSWVPSPREAVAGIERLGRMVDPPSGRYRVEVAGDTLDEILDRQARVRAVLDGQVGRGALARFEMLANHLPRSSGDSALPSPEAFAAALPRALAAAGLRPGFAGKILGAYREALAHRDIRAGDAAAVADDPAIAMRVRVEDGTLHAPALLWGVVDARAVAATVAAIGDPAIRFVDRARELTGGIDRIMDRVRLCLASGAAATIAFLFAGAPRRSRVGEVVLGCVAAALVTACAAGLLSGGISVFHLMALTLVIGIGIDYGLIATLGGGSADGGGSVLLCAATTLTAFLIMALSGVELLRDIGMTVGIGVALMVAVSAVRDRPAVPAE